MQNIKRLMTGFCALALGQDRVRWVQQANMAVHSDGANIYLPEPQGHPGEEELLVTLFFRELGRLQYTSADAVPTDSTLAKMAMAIEESRVKALIANEFKGVKDIFDRAAAVMAELLPAAEHPNDNSLAIWFAANDGLLETSLSADPCEQYAQTLTAPDKRKDKAIALAATAPLLGSTQSSVKCAAKILELLRSEAEPSQSTQADPGSDEAQPEAEDSPSPSGDAMSDALAKLNGASESRPRDPTQPVSEPDQGPQPQAFTPQEIQQLLDKLRSEPPAKPNQPDIDQGTGSDDAEQELSTAPAHSPENGPANDAQSNEATEPTVTQGDASGGEAADQQEPQTTDVSSGEDSSAESACDSDSDNGDGIQAGQENGLSDQPGDFPDDEANDIAQAMAAANACTEPIPQGNEEQVTPSVSQADEAEDASEPMGLDLVEGAGVPAPQRASNPADRQLLTMPSNMVSALLRAMQDRRYVQTRCVDSASKVHVQRFWRLKSMGDTRVMLSRRETGGIDAAIWILLDRSASMRKRMEPAVEAAYAFILGLQRTNGVQTALSVFPAEDEGYTERLLALRENAHRALKGLRAVTAEGSYTPMAEALWEVLPSIQSARAKRKIVLIITDGKPSGGERMFHLARLSAQEAGVEVIGVGIQEDITSILPNQSVSINAVDELPGALEQLFKRNVLEALAA